MLDTPALAGQVLLPFVAVIGFWVAWSDLATMKIPNRAVVALVLVYAVVGFFVLPLEAWAWRWLHLGVVLVIGFALNVAGAMGAGDAKFAAAMSPFIALGDVAFFMILFACILLAAFVSHRIMRAIPVVRVWVPDWASWQRKKDFPMGLALGPSLAAYLAFVAAYGL